MQQSRSKQARRNASPRIIKVTKREVNEKTTKPCNSPHTITTARRKSRQRGAQTTSRSSALVRGRSTEFIANPCRWPQRPCPKTSLHFCHFPAVLDHLCSNLSQSCHPISLPCALAFPTPSHRDATTPSPNDATPSALTPSLHCASILQPAAPPQVVAFEC